MAVNKTGLKSALETFFTPPELGGTLPDNDAGDAAAHQSACAQLWANAMQTYVAAMEPGHVAAFVGTASTKLKTALEGVFSGWYSSGDYDCSALNAAFDAFAADIAITAGAEQSSRTGGISRLFIGTPPPGINLCSLSSIDENTEDPYSTAAQNFADLIHSWFTKGVSDTTDDSLPEKQHITVPWR